MAMTMNGEYQLPVPRETVWEKLNDAETLKACIPGSEQLDKLSDTEFQAVVITKIGPVKAKFKGKVTLSDLDPPNGYKISGQGDGGVAGFAKGGATVKLTQKNGGTLLAYTVEALTGGRAAVQTNSSSKVRKPAKSARFCPWARKVAASHPGNKPFMGNSRRALMAAVSLTVNGKPVTAEVDPRTLLVQLLRENLRLTGTHVGCDTSQCGACVVHVDGKAVKSCTTLAVMA